MKHNNIYDKIDLELSKTYFGGNPGKKNTAVCRDPHKSVKSFPRPAGVLFLIFFFVAAVSLGVFTLIKTPARRMVPTDVRAPVPEVKHFLAATPAYHDVSGGTGIPEKSKLLYGFENGTDGWEIPLWAREKPDHVGMELKESGETASDGSRSLRLYANFPGVKWTAALIEVSQYLDLSGYALISADIYLPPDSPRGLRAKFILTIGADWRFTEMSRGLPLIPGKWNTLTADITEKSYDWRRTVVDADLRSDVRKVAIRIESDRKPAYDGPIHIDNVRLWVTNS